MSVRYQQDVSLTFIFRWCELLYVVEVHVHVVRERVVHVHIVGERVHVVGEPIVHVQVFEECVHPVG